MTRCTFLSALAAAFLIPGIAWAEAAPTELASAATEPVADVSVSESATPAEIGWEQFDDPSFDPAKASPEPSDAEILGSVPTESAVTTGTAPSIHLESPSSAAPSIAQGIVLGPLGVDDQGRAGRLHTVARGDTLWDLSAAYLGTPWVWPSVWIDNDDIANPHLILPGNKIWITANEMRVVTDAEAESFLSSMAEATAPSEMLSSEDAGLDDEMPVAAFDDLTELSDADDDASGMVEAMPALVPSASNQATMRGRRVTVARREAMGFVSAEKLSGASTIVGSPVERTYLAAGDPVYLGVGEGDTDIGDQFTLFTVIEDVRDPDTKRLLGHHVEALGWAEVKQLTGDTSIAEIRTSYSEIERGARVVRREPAPKTVEVRTSPEVIEGEVAFLPAERTLMDDGGYVYLNRGEFHGVEQGTELEVFDPGTIVEEPARGVDVRTPDHVVARLVVVTVEPDSSVGFVLWSKRELVVGDAIRPVVPTLAQR
jgi:hypothetical protein